jgi:DNA ligase-4
LGRSGGRSDTSRLLLSASEEAQDGRYYKKSLDEVDHLSLARDRQGMVGVEEDDREGDDDEKEAIGVEEDAEQEDEPKEEEEEEEEIGLPQPVSTQSTRALEAEWGLDADQRGGPRRGPDPNNSAGTGVGGSGRERVWREIREEEDSGDSEEERVGVDGDGEEEEEEGDYDDEVSHNELHALQ